MEPAERARLHSTRGGVSDTELKELAVRPTNLPWASRAVTTVTPVANMPSASRNSVGEKLGGRACFGLAVKGMALNLTESMQPCSRGTDNPAPAQGRPTMDACR